MKSSMANVPSVALLSCFWERGGNQVRSSIPKRGANIAVVLKPTLTTWILGSNQLNDRRVSTLIEPIDYHPDYATVYHIKLYINIIKSELYKALPEPKYPALNRDEYSYHVLLRRDPHNSSILTPTAFVENYFVNNVVSAHHHIITTTKTRRYIHMGKKQTTSAVVLGLFAADEARGFSDKKVMPWAVNQMFENPHEPANHSMARIMSDTPFVIRTGTLSRPLGVMKDPRVIQYDG